MSNKYTNVAVKQRDYVRMKRDAHRAGMTITEYHRYLLTLDKTAPMSVRDEAFKALRTATH